MGYLSTVHTPKQICNQIFTDINRCFQSNVELCQTTGLIPSYQSGNIKKVKNMKKIKTNKGIAPIVLLIIVMLAAGGIAAVVKTRSNKNILKESLSEQTSENNENDTTATKAKSLSPTGIAQKAYTVKLSGENSSRQSGEAVITDAGTAVKVVVSLSGMTNSTSMPSHIHTGTCAALGEIKYPLSNVSKGASQTSLN